jgi:hypothetical protein
LLRRCPRRRGAPSRRRVVEIRVVAEEQREPLALGKALERAAKLCGIVAVLVVMRGIAVALVSSRLRQCRPSLVQRGVDDRAPDPCFERTVATEGGAIAHGRRERVLHRVSRPLGVPDDGVGDPSVLLEARAVDLLDLAERYTAPVTDDPHASMTLRGARFL